MKQKRFLGFLPAVCLAALPMVVLGQNGLKLGSGVAEFSSQVAIPLTISNDSEIQGVVAVFEWTGDSTGAELRRGPVLGDGSLEEHADTVVTRVEANFMVLGVVMDSNPSDNGGVAEIIPPNAGDTLLATVVLNCQADPDPNGSPPGTEIVTALTFADNAHAAAESGPLLDNVVVVGGLSIGATEGLILTDGEFKCTAAPDKFIVEATAIRGAGDVRILMNANNEVEGFVTAVCHDGAVLTLNDIVVGADAAVADFSATEIDAAQGGALGVVIDLFDPMEMPPNILPGQGRHIASYRYTCIDPPAEATPAAVALCDGVLGDPLKDNLIVVGGRSITNADGLVFENNTVTCETGVAPPERETICDDGIDNDRDGLTDLDDPDCQTFDFEIVDPETFLPANIVGTDGDPSFGLLAYNAPTEAELGIGGNNTDVLLGDSPTVSTQGFSLALGFPCGDLAAVESFDVSGTILEAVGAEFVGVQADNTEDDGDPCSLILGVLVDAAPPFDGGVIPGLPQTQPLGRIGFIIPAGVDCGKTVLVSSADGANGRGNVPVRNVISVDNQAFAATVRPFNVIAEQRVRFFRGDCNFSLRSAGLDPVNIADAAAVVSFLFQVASLKFEPPCLDACDVNDDGRVDLADAIGILNFLFIAGSRFPPFPGPGLDENANATVPGIDVTDDDPLGCDDGSDCDVDALDPGGRGEP